MITPQNSSGDYPSMAPPQRSGSFGGHSMELLNPTAVPASAARNRIPSLSTSTISTIEDDVSPRHSFYSPTNLPLSQVGTGLNGFVGGGPNHISAGNFHGYPFPPTGQRSDLTDNGVPGSRQPYDLYTQSGGFLAPSGGYPSMESVQNNHSAYSNARPPIMQSSSSLSYDTKMTHPQDTLNRPQGHYGFQDSFQGTGASAGMRMMHQEQSRDLFLHSHPNHFDRRPIYAPFQSNNLREMPDNNFVSLFGSSVDRDSIPLPQDPYSNIHDIRNHDPYRNNVIATKPQGHGGTNQLYNWTDMNTQAYPRFPYPNMNGGYPTQEQDFHNLYSFPKADGNMRPALEHPATSMPPNHSLHGFHDPAVPTVVSRLDQELILKQSSMHISSQQTILRDTRPNLDTEESKTLHTSGSNHTASFISEPEQKNNLISLNEKQQNNESSLFTTGNISSSEVFLRVHDDYKVEQALVRNSVHLQNNDDTAKASSPVLTSVRTQDKSYLTVLQSSGAPKETVIQSPSLTDTSPPKWKLPPVPAVTAKLEVKYLYNVKFKRATEVFALDHQLVELKPGSFVKVEADRGHDMGMVVSRMPSSEYDAESRPTNASERFDKNMLEKSKSQSECTPTLKKILRLATTEEITMLDIKRKDEDEILNQCKTKAKQRGLVMNVIDAEYQFDRNKLTFFFQAQGRVDFRDLVKDLFGICKTRIWMQQIDKKPSSSDASG